MVFFVGSDVGGTFTDLWVASGDGRSGLPESPLPPMFWSWRNERDAPRCGALRALTLGFLPPDRAIRASWHHHWTQRTSDRPRRVRTCYS